MTGSTFKSSKQYTKSRLQGVHQEDTITDLIAIIRGVRQGDPVSPKLFTAALEEVFKSIDWSDKGIVTDGEHPHPSQIR